MEQQKQLEEQCRKALQIASKFCEALGFAIERVAVRLGKKLTVGKAEVAPIEDKSLEGLIKSNLTCAFKMSRHLIELMPELSAYDRERVIGILGEEGMRFARTGDIA